MNDSNEIGVGVESLDQENPKNNAMESTLLKLLKKLLLIVIGSGLVTNALYIYGLAFYQGHIARMGFEYAFFPIDWEDSLFWTYLASRELGMSTVNIWTKMGLPGILGFMFAIYMTARIWMAINANDATQSRVQKKKSLAFSRFLVKIRKWYPKRFKALFPVLRWLFNTEQSLWAFVASYFALIVLFFCPNIYSHLGLLPCNGQ